MNGDDYGTAGVQYDPETERYLLAAILEEPSKIWEVRQIVTPDDFAQPVARATFEAMCEIADRGKLVTTVSINDHLVQAGRSHEVPITYPYALGDLGAYGYQAFEYAGIVQKFGERRKLVEASDEIRRIAAEGNEDAGDVIEQAAQILNNVRGSTLRMSTTIGESFTDLAEEMRTQIPHIPTPWPSLNALIGGVRPGAMYTVAANSGGGKSIFGLQLALHVAELGGRVGYVSLEMTKHDLLKRLISMMQGIHQSALQNHQLTEEGWAAFAQAETAIRALPLDVYDRPAARWEDVVGYARALHRKGDLKLLVIDYFGLLMSPPGSRSRAQDLENMANGFKALAKELDCSVVLLEQVNRNSVDRRTPRPMITDLRGTAALEHAADAVVLLFRPEKKVQGKMVKLRDIEFIVAKNRQGATGDRVLFFQGEYARIMQKEFEHTSLIEPGEV